jgi:superfamily II DNA helicase RecQ
MLRDGGARFRGNQREAVDAITTGTSPIVHVASTGSSKTITFLLPTFYSPTSKMVVVVPFIALQQDIERRY